MAIASVQAAYNYLSSTATSMTLTLTSASTSGNAVAILLDTYACTPTTPTGFVLLNSANDSPGNSDATYLYFRPNGTSITSVTITLSPSGYANGCIQEFSGVASTATGVDVASTGSVFSSGVDTVTCPAASASGELVLAMVMTDTSTSGGTTPSGWTYTGTEGNHCFYYWTTSTSGALTTAWTPSPAPGRALGVIAAVGVPVLPKPQSRPRQAVKRASYY